MTGQLDTNQTKHILGTDEHDNQRKDSPSNAVRARIQEIDEHIPGYHGNSEAYEGTNAQASYSTNENLDGASEDKTYSVMYRKTFAH